MANEADTILLYGKYWPRPDVPPEVTLTVTVDDDSYSVKIEYSDGSQAGVFGQFPDECADHNKFAVNKAVQVLAEELANARGKKR